MKVCNGFAMARRLLNEIQAQTAVRMKESQ